MFAQVSGLGCIDLGDRRSEVQILSARPFHQLSNSSSSSHLLSLLHTGHHLSTGSISEPQYEHMSLVEDFGADAEVFCFGGLLLLLKNDINSPEK